jgi:hypothetical protein
LLELHRNIAEERDAFTRDLQGLSLDLVERAYMRMAQLGTVFVLVMFGAAVVLLLLTRRLFVARREAKS